MPRRKCEFDSRRVLLSRRRSAGGSRQMKTTTRSCLHPAYRPLPPAHCSCGGARVGTGGRLLSAKTQVRFLPPQLAKVENLSRSRTSLHMEVIRPDEEPVLKTGGGFESLVGSSPTASARGTEIANRNQSQAHSVPWSSGPRLSAYIRATKVRFLPGLLLGNAEC